MKKFILNLVNGKPAEWRRIWLLLCGGFSMGIFIATYDVAVSAQFLSHFDERKDLPLAFMLSGFLGVVLTLLFRIVQAKTGFLTVTRVFSSFLMLTTGLITVGMNGDPSDAMIFTAFAVIGPMNATVILLFWGVFGRIYNVREAKRLASGIDSGQAAATIMAFFLIPVFQTFLSEVSYLMYFSAVSIVLTSLFFWILVRTEYKEDAEVSASAAAPKATAITKKALAFQQKYIRIMSLFVLCSAMAATFVDYSFLTATAQKFSDPKELTNFLAFFEGTVMICSFLVQTFLNDHILNVYGIQAALLILPGILAVFVAISSGVGLVFGYEGSTDTFLFFFLLVAISKLITDALRDSLQGPTLKFFFFPLDKKIRFNAQAIVEGTVKEGAGLLAGALMIGLGLIEGYNVLFNNVALIVVVVIWAFVTIQMHGGYRFVLTRSLAANRPKAELLGNDELFAGKWILRYLAHPLPEVSLAAFRWIERSDPFYFRSCLLLLSDIKQEGVRRWLLRKMEEYRFLEGLPVVQEMLFRTVSPGEERVVVRTANTLEQSKKDVYDVLRLAHKSSSSSTSLRREAALLIRYNPSAETFQYLVPLLREPDRAVRTEALVTAGKKRIPELIPVLVDHLGIAGYSHVAFSALLQFGEQVMPFLETAFNKNGQQLKIKIAIVRLYRKIGGPQARIFFEDRLSYPEQPVLMEVFGALNAMNWTPNPDQAVFLRNRAESEAAKMYWNIATRLELRPDERSWALKQAIDYEIGKNFETIFLLLSLIYDRSSVELVRQNLESGLPDNMTYAIELLDIFLDDSLKNRLLPLLDDSHYQDKIRKLEVYFPRDHYEPAEALLLLVSRDYNMLNRWTRACAIHVFGEARFAHICDDLVANLFNPDPLLREVTAQALYHLDPERTVQYFKRLTPDSVRQIEALLEAIRSQKKHTTGTETEPIAIPFFRFDIVTALLESSVFGILPGVQLAAIAEFAEGRMIPADMSIAEAKWKYAPATSWIYVISGSLEGNIHGEVRKLTAGTLACPMNMPDYELLCVSGELKAVEESMVVLIEEASLYEWLFFEHKAAATLLKALFGQIEAIQIATVEQEGSG